MSKLKTLSNRLKKIVKDNNKILLLAIRDSQEDILGANKQQLLRGRTSENKSVGKYRSKSYAAYKKSLNSRGVVDLKVTGKFHDSFFLNTKKFPIVFGARDSKTSKLVAKYGDDIFGLTPQSRKSIGKIIKDNYISRVRAILQI